jgi:hypothetical protein
MFNFLKPLFKNLIPNPITGGGLPRAPEQVIVNPQQPRQESVSVNPQQPPSTPSHTVAPLPVLELPINVVEPSPIQQPPAHDDLNGHIQYRQPPRPFVKPVKYSSNQLIDLIERAKRDTDEFQM